MTRALITDGTHRNALAVIRALSCDMDIDVTSSLGKYGTLCSYSRHADATIRVSTTSEHDRYGKEMLDLLRSGKYDYFLPVGLNSYIASSKRKEELQMETHCLLPDWRDMEIAFNKERTMVLAESIGVPVPRTSEISDIDDLDTINTYPVVLKSSEQSSVQYCRDVSEAKSGYKKISSSSKTKVIAQELVTGYGCGFYGVFSHGRLMDFFLHRRLREFPITGGASAVAESYRSERLFDLGRLLGTALHWNGPLMAEFKYDERSNDYKLIEVNPKLWGSLDLTLEAGVDVPRLIIGIAEGSITSPIASRYEEAHYRDVRFRWPFPDQFKIFCARPTLRSGKELAMCDAKTNFDITDPFPNLFMTVAGLVQGSKMLVDVNKRYPHGKKPVD